MSYEELDKAYQEALQGSEEPNYVLAPEGAFMRCADGHIEVFEVDEEGVHWPLGGMEQKRAKLKIIKRILGSVHEEKD